MIAKKEEAMGTLFQTPQQTASEYRGVTGWLLFFCITLTVFNPLFALRNISTGYGLASKVADRLPGLMTAEIIDSVFVLAIMALGIFAGVCLWGVKPRAVQIAKAYLIVLAVYAVLEVGLFLAVLPSSVADPFMGKSSIAVLRTFGYVGIWYSYLSKSKRVRATYSDAEGGEYSDADGSEYIGLNLSARGPSDRARHTPQQSKPDTVEPVSQGAAPISEEKPDYKDTSS